MSEDDGPDNLLQAFTGIVAVATLPLGILSAIFLGGTVAAVVFVVGWLLLVPVLGILSTTVGTESAVSVPDSTDWVDEDSDSSRSTDDEVALQRLRERYAAGEIDEIEFERRVERLLETEDLDAADPVGSGPGVGTGSGRDAGTETDRERERKRERE